MRLAISGIDGSGKTSLCHSLVQWLGEGGISAYYHKRTIKAYQRVSGTNIIDPDDWPLSSIFFNFASVLDEDPALARARFTPSYLEYIMAMEEALLYHRDIQQLDKPNSIVVHDRHLLDRWVNAMVVGCPMQDIEQVHALVPPPNLNIILDLPGEVAEQRMLAEQSANPTRRRIEPFESVPEQNCRRDAYLAVARKNSTIRVLDATQPKDMVLAAAKLLVVSTIVDPFAETLKRG